MLGAKPDRCLRVRDFYNKPATQNFLHWFLGIGKLLSGGGQAYLGVYSALIEIAIMFSIVNSVPTSAPSMMPTSVPTSAPEMMPALISSTTSASMMTTSVMPMPMAIQTTLLPGLLALIACVAEIGVGYDGRMPSNKQQIRRLGKSLVAGTSRPEDQEALTQFLSVFSVFSLRSPFSRKLPEGSNEKTMRAFYHICQVMGGWGGSAIFLAGYLAGSKMVTHLFIKIFYNDLLVRAGVTPIDGALHKNVIVPVATTMAWYVGGATLFTYAAFQLERLNLNSLSTALGLRKQWRALKEYLAHHSRTEIAIDTVMMLLKITAAIPYHLFRVFHASAMIGVKLLTGHPLEARDRLFFYINGYTLADALPNESIPREGKIYLNKTPEGVRYSILSPQGVPIRNQLCPVDESKNPFENLTAEASQLSDTVGRSVLAAAVKIAVQNGHAVANDRAFRKRLGVYAYLSLLLYSGAKGFFFIKRALEVFPATEDGGWFGLTATHRETYAAISILPSVWTVAMTKAADMYSWIQGDNPMPWTWPKTCKNRAWFVLPFAAMIISVLSEGLTAFTSINEISRQSGVDPEKITGHGFVIYIILNILCGVLGAMATQYVFSNTQALQERRMRLEGNYDDGYNEDLRSLETLLQRMDPEERSGIVPNDARQSQRHRYFSEPADSTNSREDTQLLGPGLGPWGVRHYS